MEIENLQASLNAGNTPLAIELYARLACDLRWTWSHAADSLWKMIDADIWAKTENPIAVLQHLTHERAQSLADDPIFISKLRLLEQQRNDYMASPGWYGETYRSAPLKRVAYFSMEYGIGQALPLYAGGLGILAGDHLKTASDLGIPLVAIGLFYHEGYFRQVIDSSGWQQEAYPYNNPYHHPITPVKTASGDLLYIKIELPGRTVRLRVWQAQVGKVALYLLDSNDPLNSPYDRSISSKLYGGSREYRLIQEIVLGIGGWRLIQALKLDIDVCHLNEGHAAFVTLERARDFMHKNALSFSEALQATRVGNIFTTHTPVTAGFDTFHPDLITQYGLAFATSIGVDALTLLAMGRKDATDSNEPFNMAYLAARTCGSINGVSRLHGSVSRHIFSDLFPHWPESEVPITHITNGVHVPSWDSAWADAIWTEACGKDRWRGSLEGISRALGKVSDEQLWDFCSLERADLIDRVRERLLRQLGARGETSQRIAQAASVFDPNTLTLGFARRFAEYKRPNLLLHDRNRLQKLLTDAHRPVQIVIAGKAHPQDPVGKGFIQEWMNYIASHPKLRDRVVFVEDYDIKLAQELVQGVDVWINNPRRPWEASGTSGMKVLVNGGINLSSLDGWWAEAYTNSVGWSLGDGKQHSDPEWDSIDANQLYSILEEEVVPEFYRRDSSGIPREWVARIRASMTKLTPQYSTNRMVRQYVEELYLPAAKAFKQRADNGCCVAVELNRWMCKIERFWDEIHFGELEITRPKQDEEEFELLATVQVYLGGISPDDVKVQFYANPIDNIVCSDIHEMSQSKSIAGSINGFIYQVRYSTERAVTDFTPRIVPHHAAAFLPIELNLIKWRS